MLLLWLYVVVVVDALIEWSEKITFITCFCLKFYSIVFLALFLSISFGFR